jgi:hypothetical protein
VKLRVEHCAIAPPFEVAVYISENGELFFAKLCVSAISSHVNESRRTARARGIRA